MKEIRFWYLGLIFFFGATSVYGTDHLTESEEKKQKRRKLSPSFLDTVPYNELVQSGMLIPTLNPKNEFDIEIVGKLIPNPEKFLVPRVNYENWLNIFKALENNWNSSQIYKEYGASTRKLVFTFNKYGWLKKTDKGYYSMNPKGRRAQQIVQNAKNGIISNKDFRSFAEKHLKEGDDDARSRKRHKTIEMEGGTLLPSAF